MADRERVWASLWPRLRVPLIVVLVITELVLAYLLITVDSFTPINDDPSDQVQNGVNIAAIVSCVFTLALGVGAAMFLAWRNRWPLLISLVASLLAAFSGLWVVASIVLVNTIVRVRGWRLVAAVVGYAVAVDLGTRSPYGTALIHLLGLGHLHWLVSVLVFAAVAGGCCLIGFFVRAVGDLERADRLRELRGDRERQLIIETAKLNERNRIAHEMHDVLAHKISLLALHAGTLELQTDDEKVLETAQIIRGSAAAAMEDLRNVLAVLHSDSSGVDSLSPQPTVEDTDRLVQQSRNAGVTIDYRNELHEAPLPAHLGRTAYRIIQEALTNVHKHSPRSSATVRLSGSPGGTVHIEVANALPNETAVVPLVVESGRGLPGIGERVALAKGRLEYGVRDNDQWVISADLPWPDPSPPAAVTSTLVGREDQRHAATPA